MLTISLPPDLETRVRETAGRLGEDPVTFARTLIQRALPPLQNTPVASGDPTLALFAQWAKEDHTDDPKEIARRMAEFEEFKAALNETRRLSGARFGVPLNVPSVIILDSGPLGLLMQREGLHAADECRAWAASHLAKNARLIVPEIVDYELRRELLRMNLQTAVNRLDAFLASPPDRFLSLTSEALRVAADFWATFRRQGTPTASPDAIDIDVILAAQVVSHGYAPMDCVVATTNLSHLSRLVSAKMWSDIR